MLSAATRDRDLSVKRDLYAAEGVRWYLVIDPDQQETAVLRLTSAGRFETIPLVGRHEIDLCDNCLLRLNLTGIG